MLGFAARPVTPAILAVILATTAWAESFSQPVLLVLVVEISLEPALLPMTWDLVS